MLDHFPLPTHGKPERRHLYRWVKLEEDYARKKFETEHVQPRDDGVGGLQDYDLEVFWERQIVQYLDRVKDALRHARQLRIIDDEEGARHLEMKAQQAMIKCMMTVKGLVESSIRVYGPLPKPGLPSGEIQPWLDPVFEAARDA